MAATAGKAKVVVGQEHIESTENDWYTPKAFRVYPQTVTVSIGKKGRDEMQCEILEGEWEHRSVHLSFKSQDVRAPGLYYGLGVKDFHGSMNAEQIDRLIHVLTVARQEAEKLGLFTERPTPKSIDEARGTPGYFSRQPQSKAKSA